MRCDAIRNLREMPPDCGHVPPSHVPLAAFDFLKLIEVLDDDSINKTYLEYFKNGVSNFLNNEMAGSKEEAEDLAATLAILARMNDVAKGCGLPSTLIEVCGSGALDFIHGLNDKLQGQT